MVERRGMKMKGLGKGGGGEGCGGGMWGGVWGRGVGRDVGRGVRVGGEGWEGRGVGERWEEWEWYVLCMGGVAGGGGVEIRGQPSVLSSLDTGTAGERKKYTKLNVVCCVLYVVDVVVVVVVVVLCCLLHAVVVLCVAMYLKY